MAQTADDHSTQRKWLLAAIGVALLLGFLLWSLLRPDPPALTPQQEQPTQTAFESPPAAPPPAPEPAAPPVPPVPDVTPLVESPPPLPTLDNSDPEVKTALSELPGKLDSLIAHEYLVRKAVRAVAALADGELVNQYRPLQNPKGAFTAERQGDAYQLSEANFRRYTPYVDAATAVGSERMLALYERYRPLLEEAYRELGEDSGDFESALVTALEQMLAVNPDVDTTLVRPTVMYKFKDPEVEGLPAAQKLMLRIGPENRAKLQPLLESLHESVTQR